MATLNMALVIPEVGWKRIDDRDVNLRYYLETSLNNTTGHYNNTRTILPTGSSIKFLLNGNKIRIIATTNTTVSYSSSNVSISIDGIIENFSTVYPTAVNQALVYEKNISDGIHEVIIVNNETSFQFDAIDINDSGSISPYPNGVGLKLVTPENGWKRFDESYSALNFEGIWTLTENTNAYGGFYRTASSNNNIRLSFKFTGTRLRIISYFNSAHNGSIKIKIDNKNIEEFSLKFSSTVYYVVCYEKLGLTDEMHTVEIWCDSAVDSGNIVRIDAIDIDINARLYHFDEVTDIYKLDIGKRIRSGYFCGATNTVGSFYGSLGNENGDFIPNIGTNLPNGDLYFICVDKDPLGRLKLIADRRIQTSISWDTLNNEGFTSGSGLPIKSKFSYVNILPKMTSNTLPSGIASSSSETATYASWKAFDLSDTSFWMSSNSGFPHWLKYELPSSKVIMKYSMRSHSSTIDLHTMPKSWTFEGSNDNLNWTVLHTASNEPAWLVSENRLYSFNNTQSYKFYRVNISNSHDSTTFKASIGDFQLLEERALFTTADADGFEFTVRLPTGGFNSSDKDNEWDKYILDSDLNKTIEPSDDKVWNSKDIMHLTSTVMSNGTSRVIRNSGSASNFASYTSSGVSTSYGFRPVLLIALKIRKILIKSNNTWKTWDTETSSWIEVTTVTPTESDFLNHGMNSLSDMTIEKFDLLEDENISIDYYTTDAVTTIPTFSNTSVPTDRIVEPVEDINISNVLNIDSFTLSTNTTGQGLIKTVVSFDSGLTWKTWDVVSSSWSNISLTVNDVKTKGMTPNTLAGITSDSWSSLRGDSNVLRFAYLLSIESSTDSANTDTLIAQFDMQGSWKSYRNFDYEYKSNVNLQVSILDDGDYKINY